MKEFLYLFLSALSFHQEERHPSISFPNGKTPHSSTIHFSIGIGSILGAVAYRLSRTAKAKQLESEIYNAIHRIGRDAEIAAAHAERKAVDLGLKAVEAGAEIADKVADEADKVAGKAKDKWGK